MSARETQGDAHPEAEVELEAMLAQASLDEDASAYVVSLKLPWCYTWVIDSGCSHHMTPISDDYLSYAAYSSPRSVQLADKSSIDAIGEGTVKIVTIVNGVKHKIHLQHTLVPALTNSLLSVKTLNCWGYSALFRPHTVFIVNPKEVVIGESEKGGNLYDLHIIHSTAHMPAWLTLDVLHKRLGHPGLTTLQQMIQKGAS